MYLQITEKCNMTCAHCGFSCTMGGKHGDRRVIMDAIRFATDYGDEFIEIGGGEPTLHPDFFDILKTCLWEFENTWMATNGSQTDIMYRLHDIINNEDHPECDCEELDPEQYEKYDCLCHEKLDYYPLMGEDKLEVVLSQDCYHDPIDSKILDLWKRNNYEIRDVSDGVSDTGRANKNQLSSDNTCVCAGIIIKPTGKLKLCGCEDSPIIGDIYSGVENKWANFMDTDEYRGNNCYH